MVSVLWMEQKALKAATLPVALPVFPIFRSLGLGPEQSRGPSRGPSPRKGRACLGGMSKSVTSFRTKPPHFGHDRSFGCWYRRQDVSVLRTLFPSDWNSRHDEQRRLPVPSQAPRGVALHSCLGAGRGPSLKPAEGPLFLFRSLFGGLRLFPVQLVIKA